MQQSVIELSTMSSWEEVKQVYWVHFYRFLFFFFLAYHTCSDKTYSRLAENKVLSSSGSHGSQDGIHDGRPKSVGSGSSSSSSSSSGRGSLSTVGYLCEPKRRVVSGGPAGYVAPPGALEEDDLDHESGSQNLLCEFRNIFLTYSCCLWFIAKKIRWYHPGTCSDSVLLIGLEQLHWACWALCFGPKDTHIVLLCSNEVKGQKPMIFFKASKDIGFVSL